MCNGCTWHSHNGRIYPYKYICSNCKFCRKNMKICPDTDSNLLKNLIRRHGHY